MTPKRCPRCEGKHCFPEMMDSAVMDFDSPCDNEFHDGECKNCKVPADESVTPEWGGLTGRAEVKSRMRAGCELPKDLCIDHAVDLALKLLDEQYDKMVQLGNEEAEAIEKELRDRWGHVARCECARPTRAYVFGGYIDPRCAPPARGTE